MFEQIKDFFRKRKIRRYSRAVPTNILPLSEISTVNVVIDVEEQEYDLLKEDIVAWGKAAGKSVMIYYFDFRKLGKNELLLTSIQTTISRKELNWFDMPPYDRVAPLIEQGSDMFISLIDNGNYPIDFLSKCAAARFKIGRKAYPGHCYDMVMVAKPAEDNVRTGGREVFAAIVEFLGKIEK